MTFPEMMFYAECEGLLDKNKNNDSFTYTSLKKNTYEYARAHEDLLNDEDEEDDF